MIEIGGIGGIFELIAQNEVAGPGPADPTGVERFEGLMGAGGATPEGAAGLDSLAGIGAGQVSDASTLGDAILAGLQQMRDSYSSKVGELDAALAARPEGMVQIQEVLAAQVALTRLTLEQDLIAKAAGKATQDIDTLLKSQ